MQKGVTLVELAIVIVIIGLLLGGILAGRDLINEAKIYSQIQQIEGYKVSQATFKLKYNAYPGDFKNAEKFFANAPAGINGNGNNKIDQDEYVTYWVHLTLAELVTGSYSGTTALDTNAQDGAIMPGVNFPYAKYNNQGCVDISSSFTMTGTNKPIETSYNVSGLLKGGHWSNPDGFIDGPDPRGPNDPWGLQYEYKGTQVGGCSGGIFSPQTAYDIDRKLDDGKPYSGQVISDNAEDSQGNIYSTCVIPDPDINGQWIYKLDVQDAVCMMFFNFKWY